METDHRFGDGGNNLLNGRGGNDHLYGGAERDWLYGQLGDDLLVGGDRNDHLNGGRGVDMMRGGGANDRFIALDGKICNLFGDGGDDVALADDQDVLTSIGVTSV